MNLANVIAHEAMLRARPRRHGFVMTGNTQPMEQVQHAQTSLALTVRPFWIDLVKGALDGVINVPSDSVWDDAMLNLLTLPNSW